MLGLFPILVKTEMFYVKFLPNSYEIHVHQRGNHVGVWFMSMKPSILGREPERYMGINYDNHGMETLL